MYYYINDDHELQTVQDVWVYSYVAASETIYKLKDTGWEVYKTPEEAWENACEDAACQADWALAKVTVLEKKMEEYLKSRP
jgi:hypothetical protein